MDLVGVITADATSTVEARWRLRLESQQRVLHQPDGRHLVLDRPDVDPDLVADRPDVDPDLVADVLAGLDTVEVMAGDVDPVHEVAVRDDEARPVAPFRAAASTRALPVAGTTGAVVWIPSGRQVVAISTSASSRSPPRREGRSSADTLLPRAVGCVRAPALRRRLLRAR